MSEKGKREEKWENIIILWLSTVIGKVYVSGRSWRAYIRGLTKLIANDRVWRPVAQGRGAAPARSQLVRDVNDRWSSFILEIPRNRSQIRGRTSNGEKCARRRDTIRVTDYLPTSRPERDIENRYNLAYNAYSSISRNGRRWQIPAPLSQCCE